MAAHNELGKEGEEAASAYLSSRGYRIRHRNWHVGKLELDIIAEKDGELIVVEVKTRRNTRFGLPEEAVTERKIRRIVLATDAYVKRFAIDLPVRFDIITYLAFSSSLRSVIAPGIFVGCVLALSEVL